MKGKILLIFFILFISNHTFSQNCNWEWARGATENNYSEGWAIATDNEGNVYSTGFFTGDTLAFGNTMIIATGGSTSLHMYIAKYSGAGNLLWAKGAVGKLSSASGIACDKNNNVYVTGYFGADSATFGNVTLYTHKVGSQNIFIVKYDASGNVVWAKSSIGNKLDEAKAIAIDKDNNVYITGASNSDSMILGTYRLYNTGNQPVFIAKYDSNANVLWAKNITGNTFDLSLAVANDNDGNAIITGYFNDSITFGNTVLISRTIHSSAVFVAKYDTAGSILWAKVLQADIGYAIATDNRNNIYLTGIFTSDSVVIDSITIYKSLLSSTNTQNAYIIKLNAEGNAIWAKSAGGKNDNRGFNITTDLQNNVYFSGLFSNSTIAWDGVILPEPLPHCADTVNPCYDPLFIFELDSTGAVIAKTGLATGGDDEGGISVDRFGNGYVGGDASRSPLIIANDTLTHLSSEAIFIAKFKSGGSATTTNVFDLNLSPVLQVYPNPFSLQASIIYRLPEGFENATLIVYDLLGRECTRIKLDNRNGQISIDTKNLTNGFYLCSLTSDGNIFATQRVVISK